MNNKKTKLGLLAGATALTSIFTGTASAQDANTPTQAEENRTLDVITVTARRREESLQDVPVSVSIVSAEALARQGITATTDLDQIVPNLQFTSYGTLTGNNSSAQVFIRGIGQTDATGAVDPGVGLYIDDVYIGRSVGGAMDFRDIANVQVLRGPQGTLFGRNTIGGAVLMTSNRPGAGNTVRVGLGTDNLFEAFGAFDLLATDEFGARVAVGTRQRDGYVERVFDSVDLGNDDTISGLVTTEWTPSEAVNFTLRADYAKEDENGSPFVFADINPNALFPIIGSIVAGCPGASFPPPTANATLDDPRCANEFQDLGDELNGGTFPAVSTLENYGFSLIGEWNVNENLTLKSISSARNLEWSGSRDADNTPILILHTQYESESEQISQELQAQFEYDRLNGVFGLYYFDEETNDRLIVQLATPGTSYDTQRVNLTTEAFAAFTEWTYDFSDAFSVTGGLRYTEEEKTIGGTLFNVGGVDTPEPAIPTADTLCNPSGPPGQTECLFITPGPHEVSFDSITGSASAQYRWNESLMTFVSFSQGFKSGGFNQRYNAAPPGNLPLSFNEETAENWELGFKSNPAANVRLNGSIFTTTYDDIQMTYRLGVVPLLFNAGEAEISGAELELYYMPVSSMIIDASLGYLDAKFNSINDPAPISGVTPTAIATVDSDLPFTPDLQAHVGVSYEWQVGNNVTLTPRLDVSYTDSQFFDAGNSAIIAQTDAITLLNGSITFAHDNGFTLSFSGENLTDERYPVAGTSSLGTSSGYAEIVYARPRSFMMTLTKDF